MVSVEEASSIILSNLFKPKKEKVALSECVGRVLAEPVAADRDLPPFDRVTMDGIAISFDAFENGLRNFRIISTQAAGEPPHKLHKPDDCVEVMTGAVLPKGADTIVRYEDLSIQNKTAAINTTQISRRENIHSTGVDAKKNDPLLAAGTRISSAEVALLASVGLYEVTVYNFPKTAIISTGDELVPVTDSPLPHQVRQSNGYALQSSLDEMRCSATLFHVRDQSELMQTEFRAMLSDFDVLVISGGVSKGKFDFVPVTLETLGIKKLFHQVSQKPGKPFWFGKNPDRWVFALPGNPVSTYLCFYRFLRPWLLASLGVTTKQYSAILSQDVTFNPDLTYFLQVKIHFASGRAIAVPHTGGGSGDFANLRDVDGFLELPLHRSVFNAGEAFPFIPFRSGY